MSRHACAHQRIPVDKKGLRKIRLDTNNLEDNRKVLTNSVCMGYGKNAYLMMDIMIVGIITKPLERIER